MFIGILITLKTIVTLTQNVNTKCSIINEF